MHPEVTDMIKPNKSAKPTTFLFMLLLFNCPTGFFAVVEGLTGSVSKGLKQAVNSNRFVTYQMVIMLKIRQIWLIVVQTFILYLPKPIKLS